MMKNSIDLPSLQTSVFFLVLVSAFNAYPVTTNRWVSPSSSLWRITTNWSATQPPSTSFDYTVINNGGSKTVTIDNATAPNNLSVRSLIVSASAGSTNTLLLSSLSSPFTTSKAVTIGSGGILQLVNSTIQAQDVFDISGSLTIDSGLLDTTTPNFVGVRVGRANGAVGTVLLNGGMLKCFGFRVGELAGSSGICTVNGGTLLSSSVVSLGEIVNSPGAMTIQSGNLIATNDITKVGNLAAGQLFLTGGKADLAFLSIGDNATGLMNISGGQLIVTPATATDVTRVGNFGDAQLDISGGTVWFRGQFDVADNPGVNGTVTMTGGHLVATNDLVAIGRYGIGEMTITNATAYFTNASVGRHTDALGTLNLQAGGTIFCVDDLSIGRFTNATGHVVVSGGLLSLTNDNIWAGREGIGDLTVSGGLVRAGSLFVGKSEDGINTPQGTVTLGAGTLLLSSNLIVGTSLLSTGRVDVLGGELTVTNKLGAGLLTVTSGSFILNGGAATLDRMLVTNNNGQFTFAGGTLKAGSITVSNGAPFVVGDGARSATLTLEGGTYTFVDGLIIAANATLNGCGTVIGSILNHGTIATNCGGTMVAPSISQPPQDQTVALGANARFTVVASGTEPLSYQWQHEGVTLAGATASVYAKTNAQISDAGAYSVVVSNVAGTVSASANLRVLAPPILTSIQELGGTNTIGFASVVGVTYTLEFKNALTDPTWTPILPATTGTGGLIHLQDSTASVPMRFYRLRGE